MRMGSEEGSMDGGEVELAIQVQSWQARLRGDTTLSVG